MQLFSLSSQLSFNKVCAYNIYSIYKFLCKEVPPDRQKVMIGGVTVQDDDWGKAKAKIKEVENYNYFDNYCFPW